MESLNEFLRETRSEGKAETQVEFSAKMPENFTIYVRRYKKWWKRVILFLTNKIDYDILVYSDCQITQTTIVGDSLVVEFEGKDGSNGSLTYKVGGEGANERIQQIGEKDTE